MIKRRIENSRLRSHVDVDDILKLLKLNGTSLSHPTTWALKAIFIFLQNNRGFKFLFQQILEAMKK